MNHTQAYKFCLSFVWGGVIAAVLTKIAASFIKTDESYFALAEKYPLDMADVLPEPQEMTGFVLFWLIYAVSFFLLYSLFDKVVANGRRGVVGCVGMILTVVGTFVLLFAEEDYFYINMSWFMRWQGAVLSALIFGGMFLVSQRFDLERLFDVLSVVLICGSSLFCFVRNPLFGTNMFHFNGFFTTIYNAYYGAALGVESKIIYGTYAYLFVPIYKLIGLSLSNYALITMIMCMIIMLCEFYILRNLVVNPVIRFLALSVCIYINVYFAVNAHYEQFITQHFPMRIFFPMIMMAYIVCSAKKNKLLEKGRFLVGVMICYLAFMMNLESAVTTCLTWVSACFYSQLTSLCNSSVKNKIQGGARIAVAAAAGAAAAFLMWLLTVEAVCFMKTGGVIKVSELYATQMIFSKVGYGMLPLPDYFHLYIFVFLIYALFLGMGIWQIFFEKAEDVFRGQITFGLSVTGILMLIYYMGRTHNRSLFTWLGPCVILLSYLSEKTLAGFGNAHGKTLKFCLASTGVLTFLILSIYASSEIYILKNSEYFQDYAERQIKNNYDEKIYTEIDLLKKYADNGTVNYIGNYAAGISMAAGVKNNFQGEMAACWYSWDDYQYIQNFIKNCNGYVIIDSTALSQINKYIQDEFNEIMEEKGYTVIDNSGISTVYGL